MTSWSHQDSWIQLNVKFTLHTWVTFRLKILGIIRLQGTVFDDVKVIKITKISCLLLSSFCSAEPQLQKLALKNYTIEECVIFPQYVIIFIPY